MKKLLLNHIRLWISLFLGVAVSVLAPHEWSAVTRVLTGWNCGVVLFLALIYKWMPRLTAEEICDQFIEEDETAPFLLAGCVVAAFLSQVAIVALLSTLTPPAAPSEARTSSSQLSPSSVHGHSFRPCSPCTMRTCSIASIRT